MRGTEDAFWNTPIRKTQLRTFMDLVFNESPGCPRKMVPIHVRSTDRVTTDLVAVLKAHPSDVGPNELFRLDIHEFPTAARRWSLDLPGAAPFQRQPGWPVLQCVILVAGHVCLLSADPTRARGPAYWTVWNPDRGGNQVAHRRLPRLPALTKREPCPHWTTDIGPLEAQGVLVQNAQLVLVCTSGVSVLHTAKSPSGVDSMYPCGTLEALSLLTLDLGTAAEAPVTEAPAAEAPLLLPVTYSWAMMPLLPPRCIDMGRRVPDTVLRLYSPVVIVDDPYLRGTWLLHPHLSLRLPGNSVTLLGKIVAALVTRGRLPAVLVRLILQFAADTFTVGRLNFRKMHAGCLALAVTSSTPYQGTHTARALRQLEQEQRNAGRQEMWYGPVDELLEAAHHALPEDDDDEQNASRGVLLAVLAHRLADARRIGRGGPWSLPPWATALLRPLAEGGDDDAQGRLRLRRGAPTLLEAVVELGRQGLLAAMGGPWLEALMEQALGLVAPMAPTRPGPTQVAALVFLLLQTVPGATPAMPPRVADALLQILARTCGVADALHERLGLSLATLTSATTTIFDLPTLCQGSVHDVLNAVALAGPERVYHEAAVSAVLASGDAALLQQAVDGIPGLHDVLQNRLQLCATRPAPSSPPGRLFVLHEGGVKTVAAALWALWDQQTVAPQDTWTRQQVDLVTVGTMYLRLYIDGTTDRTWKAGFRTHRVARTLLVVAALLPETSETSTGAPASHQILHAAVESALLRLQQRLGGSFPRLLAWLQQDLHLDLAVASLAGLDLDLADVPLPSADPRHWAWMAAMGLLTVGRRRLTAPDAACELASLDASRLVRWARLMLHLPLDATWRPRALLEAVKLLEALCGTSDAREDVDARTWRVLGADGGMAAIQEAVVAATPMPRHIHNHIVRIACKLLARLLQRHHPGQHPRVLQTLTLVIDRLHTVCLGHSQGLQGLQGLQGPKAQGSQGMLLALVQSGHVQEALKAALARHATTAASDANVAVLVRVCTVLVDGLAVVAPQMQALPPSFWPALVAVQQHLPSTSRLAADLHRVLASFTRHP